MCGIAGYSLTASSPLERTLAAQASWLESPSAAPTQSVTLTALPARASVRCTSSARAQAPLLEEITVPQSATESWSTSATTKGHPTVAANNHPIRHGAVIGIHNGVIHNDDELLADHDCARASPE